MMNVCSLFRGSILAVASFCWLSPLSAQDWSSIRGDQFDASASGDVSDLRTGPLNLTVVWKQPIGSGYSGVVKSGERLATAMADVPADQEFVVAMDWQTGKTLWKTETGPVFKGANGSFDGPIATPAIDSNRVYHLSPHGKLAAYQIDDGQVVWERDLKAEFSSEPNFYGFGASPILHEDRLIVPVGGKEAAIVAFDVATGKVLWKAGDDTVAFQSPILVQINGDTAVIAAGNTTLMAIEPATGNVLWTRQHSGASGAAAWSILPLPLADGGLFFNDGRSGSAVLDLTQTGCKERWTGRDIRNSYCIPVVSGGLVCSYSSRILTAVDPVTGDRYWRVRSPKDGFLATVAGRLVSATINGNLHIGDVDQDGFHEVAATKVFETSGEDSEGLLWALPSIAGHSVYLRSLGAIARVDISPGSASSKAVAETTEVSPDFKVFLAKLEKSQDKQSVIAKELDGITMPIIHGDYVHFVLQGDHEDVVVASELFGGRQERRMQRVEGTNLFYYGVKLPQPTRASYAFFADYQPVVDPQNPRQVESSTLVGEMEPAFMGPAKPLMFSWFDTADQDAGLSTSAIDRPGTLVGSIDEKTLNSKAMNETIGLSVYLPPGYPADSPNGYPVVFVHDGEPALKSGNQAAIVDDLIERNVIRPTVVVFIKRRFYPMRGANGYDKMFADELIPMIQLAYRISSDRANNASLGGGFGATLGLMGALPASDQIARIGCHAPFAFEMLQPIISALASLPGKRCQVRVEWGQYELRNPGENWDMSKQARRVGEILAQGGHEVTAKDVGGGTDWVCWRQQSESMWKFLVGQ